MAAAVCSSMYTYMLPRCGFAEYFEMAGQTEHAGARVFFVARQELRSCAPRMPYTTTTTLCERVRDVRERDCINEYVERVRCCRRVSSSCGMFLTRLAYM